MKIWNRKEYNNGTTGMLVSDFDPDSITVVIDNETYDIISKEYAEFHNATEQRKYLVVVRPQPAIQVAEIHSDSFSDLVNFLDSNTSALIAAGIVFKNETEVQLIFDLQVRKIIIEKLKERINYD